MRAQFRPALVVLLILTAFTGLLYPLAMTGAGGLLFPDAAQGSLVRGASGAPIGSRLIAQPFSGAGYFQPRPSAAAADASVSSGTNLGPTNAVRADSFQARAGRRRAEDPAHAQAPIPADLLTASGSGLDPDLSPAAAQWQALRVAKTRGITPAAVDSLIAVHTEGRLWGLFGEPRVNVLALNLALDSLTPAMPASH
ncbi:MAG TPA: potassium-transporting ATPase subunit KdpC [Gemmatimonadales bacterium]|nr:potassium-transporting ATPase subunit KdpC [Gemmatimonadales bacterium]